MKLFNVMLLFIASTILIGTSLNFKMDEKFTPTIKSYDNVDYAGYTIDSSNVNSFSQSLNLSRSNLETPIFQFVITPSERGNGTKYSPDFENLVFTLSDSKGKTMTISFSPRKADSPKYYYINAMAKGENQDLLGEHQGNIIYSADPDDGTYLSDTYSAISPYTFDGYGADYSWFPFYDKNGNTFSGGCNGVISIYYDKTENALYADTGYKWADDDPTKEWTLTDKYTKTNSGERRYRIRDFDKPDYIRNNKDNVVRTIWNGFDNPKDVTLKISFNKVLTDSPSILLVTVGGKSIVDNYYLKNNTKAIKDVEFPIPKPLFFSEGNSYDFETYNGKVKIEDSLGNVVLSLRDYERGMIYTPDKVGKYNIYYSLVDPVYNTPTSYKYSFEVLSEGGTVLKPKGVDRIYVLYESIDAGYTISNNVQDELPNVNLKIEKDGVEVLNLDNAENLNYKFESKGEYTFTYTSTDLLGRKTTIIKNYNVSEYCLKIKEGLAESIVISDYSSVTRPLNSDYYIMNVFTGDVVSPTSVSILMSKDDGEYKPYNKDNYINGDGSYKIKYVYNYSDITLEAYRNIMVFENLPVITIKDVPKNTILDNGCNITDDTVRVLALKGSIISIPKGYFTSESAFTVEVYEAGGTLVDSTTSYNSNTLTITLNELKDYYVSAKTETDKGFIIKKNILFVVKETVVNFAEVEDLIGSVGHEVSLVMPEAKDFYNNTISSGTLSVLFNEEEIEVVDSKFTPKDLGTYRIIYTVSINNTNQTYEYKCKIIDDEAPEIIIGSSNVSCKLGDFVSVNNFTIKDNSNKAVEVKTTVYLNGEIVPIYNDGFDVSQAGNYEVRIVATDMVGNTSTNSYTVTVKNKGCSSSIYSSSVLTLIILLSSIAVILRVRNIKMKKEY